MRNDSLGSGSETPTTGPDTDEDRFPRSTQEDRRGG